MHVVVTSGGHVCVLHLPNAPAFGRRFLEREPPCLWRSRCGGRGSSRHDLGWLDDNSDIFIGMVG